jgi:hypothetical protein
MVAPFVYNGICTLTLMAKKKVASSSYINPHGDLKWMFFGRTELNAMIYSVNSENSPKSALKN